MVGAPPSSIGKFGADTDNWMWPRHTGDFSLFRIYAGEDNLPAEYAATNIPYTPEHYLPISMNGVKDGDFTMVFGFPGRTNEYLPSFAIEQITEVRNPANIKTREMALEIMDSYMRRSDKVRIQYAATYASIANYWKKWIGENTGIRETRAVEKKKETEELFTKRVNDNRRFDSSYKDLLPQFQSAYEELEDYALARDYTVEICYRAVKSVGMAYQASRFMRAMEGEDAEQQEKEFNALLGRFESVFKNYDTEVDEHLARVLLPHYFKNIDELIAPSLKELRASGDPESEISDLYTNSLFSDADRFNSAAEKGAKYLYKKIRKDDLYGLASDIWNYYSSEIGPNYGAINNRIDSLMRIYMAAQMEVIPERTYYPDANSTLRVSYGQVNGFQPRDAVSFDHSTTLDGVIAKYVPGDYEFDLPAKLIELWENEDYGPYTNENGKVPVCFIASNHTTGGNSGSPAIDGKGRLIGLNFDRVWEGTMSDLNFDESRCRNIMVDIRYVLFIVDKFAGASHLVEEMDLVYDSEASEVVADDLVD
jgi:hypothetical protein